MGDNVVEAVGDEVETAEGQIKEKIVRINEDICDVEKVMVMDVEGKTKNS